MAEDRTMEGRATKRRLFLVALGLLILPLLGLLGTLGYRQIETQRELLARRTAVAAVARIREQAEELRETFAESIRASDTGGSETVFRFDTSGRLLAPRLPPASGQEIQELDREFRERLERGRELEWSWGDTRAAIGHYRMLLEEAETPAQRVAAQLELLATHAGRGDWEGVVALAEPILRQHERRSRKLLNRVRYLHVRLAHLEALQRLGREDELRRAGGRFRKQVVVAEIVDGFGGASFYLSRLRELLGSEGPSMRRTRRVARLVANAAVERGLVRGVGREGRLFVETSAEPPLLVGLHRLAPDGGDGAFRLVPLNEGRTLLSKNLSPLVEEGVELRLTGPSDVPVWSGGAIADPETVRSLPLSDPFDDWTLSVGLAPSSLSRGPFDRQLLILGGLLAASVLILLGAVGYLVRHAGRAIEFARLRTDFVAGVTHDLKTPLSLIRMYAETLRLEREGDPAERRRFLDVILGEVARLTDLVENVLRFHRTGERPITRTAERLEETVRRVVDDFQVPPDSDHELRVRFDEDLPDVRHDRAAIERVLRNLLSNAIKFSPEGGPIRVSVVHKGSDLEIRVRDRGLGIREADRSRLTDPFYRGENAKKRSGTGLGLAVVKQIADAHGGTVEIESEEGEGTMVAVRLPV